MAICCASCGGHEAARTSWLDTMAHPWPILVDATTSGEGAGSLTKFDRLATLGRDSDLLCYLHADTFTLAKGWDERVIEQFASDDRVAVAGFFGARTIGHRDIYKVPYSHLQLARGDCWSNMVDAETHGRRSIETMDVAVVDSFACIVRRSFLDAIGGWRASGLPPNHFSDIWICLMAHRHGKRVLMIPIACQHASGGTGLAGFDPAAWAATTRWRTLDEMHREGSRRIYDEFRDVLPLAVTGGMNV